MMKLTRVMTLVAVSSILAMSPAAALTFKKGQVLGADGKIYDGASPEQEEALIKKAED